VLRRLSNYRADDVHAVRGAHHAPTQYLLIKRAPARGTERWRHIQWRHRRPNTTKTWACRSLPGPLVDVTRSTGRRYSERRVQVCDRLGTCRELQTSCRGCMTSDHRAWWRTTLVCVHGEWMMTETSHACPSLTVEDIRFVAISTHLGWIDWWLMIVLCYLLLWHEMNDEMPQRAIYLGDVCPEFQQWFIYTDKPWKLPVRANHFRASSVGYIRTEDRLISLLLHMRLIFIYLSI